MRRFKQQIPHEEIITILNTATSGVLSLIDADGQPYGVPMSFVYDGKDSLYFHCAKEGRKLDCINYNHFACFTIIVQDDIQPEEFTTYFQSVIAEGEILIVSDHSQIIESLLLLSSKYSPGIDCRHEIEHGIGRVTILKMIIDKVTGKEAIELLRKRVK